MYYKYLSVKLQYSTLFYIVLSKKQLKNSEIDVFSGNRFDKENNKYAFSFEDLVKVDEEKLKNAFGG